MFVIPVNRHSAELSRRIERLFNVNDDAVALRSRHDHGADVAAGRLAHLHLWMDVHQAVTDVDQVIQVVVER